MNRPLEAIPLKGWAFSFPFSLSSLLIKEETRKGMHETDIEVKIKP